MQSGNPKKLDLQFVHLSPITFFLHVHTPSESHDSVVIDPKALQAQSKSFELLNSNVGNIYATIIFYLYYSMGLDKKLAYKNCNQFQFGFLMDKLLI